MPDVWMNDWNFRQKKKTINGIECTLPGSKAELGPLSTGRFSHTWVQWK